jgi:hypothetical protein
MTDTEEVTSYRRTCLPQPYKCIRWRALYILLSKYYLMVCNKKEWSRSLRFYENTILPSCEIYSRAE